MKILKNENDYNWALTRVEELIDIAPPKNSALSDELEVLSLLISNYENEKFPIDLPDPIDAIKFRIEQLGLKSADLAEFIGSKSKVSEILNRKRKLSLTMIRNLHRGLGIPAEILISDPGNSLPEELEGINWRLFPISEMLQKKWICFEGSLSAAKENAEELVRSFFRQAAYSLNSIVLFRQGIRSDTKIDRYALAVWHAKVIIEEQKLAVEKKFDSGFLTASFFEDLKKLSIFDEGPLLAREFLLKSGIKLVVVPHLKKTHIDGAAFFNNSGEPVIALTLRYDRLDAFWFTLFHELAHLVMHLSDKTPFFFDDLKAVTGLDSVEIEADNFAENSLISRESWQKFHQKFLKKTDLEAFADQHRISAAIVAGRIQKESGDYRKFRDLLGQNKLKSLFET